MLSRAISLCHYLPLPRPISAAGGISNACPQIVQSAATGTGTGRARTRLNVDKYNTYDTNKIATEVPPKT